MKVSAVAVLMSVTLATAAAAEDVPLPLKKPKDAKGLPITKSDGAPAAVPNATKAERPANPEAAAKPGSVEKSGAADTMPTPGKTTGAAGVWPKTLDEAKEEAEARAKAAPVPTEWPAAEIAEAQAMCKTILEKIDAVTIPEPAFRQGECGTPAPVRLITIGKKPEVALSPPPVLTCGMVGALHTWLTKDLQPLARKSLGADVIKIESMSDYSCRNAYGRTKTKLSEHGRANALDIRGFVTSKGETAVVLTGWGETQRDILARQEALKVAAEKAAAEAAKIARPAVAPTAAPVAAAGEGAGVSVRDTIADGIDGKPGQPSFGVAPQHLGGPDTPAAPPKRMQTFLRGAHASACEIFGTTLGPEANNAHRNHFHVDMAPRKVKKICD